MSCIQVSHNIRAVAGDIISRTLTFRDEDNNPYNLDIYHEIIMQVREDTGTPILAQASLSAGDFTITGPGNNKNILNLLRLEVPLVAGKYKFDIEFSNVGVRHTLVRGSFIVIPQITEV